jgi:hypothetical protein
LCNKREHLPYLRRRRAGPRWIWAQRFVKATLEATRRPRDTPPIWKLEAALKCRSYKKGHYAPPVHMIKLTETREITPYVWVHLDDERWAPAHGQFTANAVPIAE